MSRGLIRGEIGGHATEAAQNIIPKDSLFILRKLIIQLSAKVKQLYNLR